MSNSSCLSILYQLLSYQKEDNLNTANHGESFKFNIILVSNATLTLNLCKQLKPATTILPTLPTHIISTLTETQNTLICDQHYQRDLSGIGEMGTVPIDICFSLRRTTDGKICEHYRPCIKTSCLILYCLTFEVFNIKYVRQICSLIGRKVSLPSESLLSANLSYGWLVERFNKTPALLCSGYRAFIIVGLYSNQHNALNSTIQVYLNY